MPEYIPPTQNPQFVGSSVSALCQLGPRPLVMTGLIRQILIQHFGSSDNIEEPGLRNTLWNAGDTTKIVIESITRWRPELTGKRPAVILKRNSYRKQKLGFNEQWKPVANLPRNGQQHFSVLWIGSHTLFCIATEGAETEILAAEVQREMTQFGPKIRESLGLIRFECVEIGPLHQLQEDTEKYTVPVTVGYAYDENWEIWPQLCTLQRISLSMMLEP